MNSSAVYTNVFDGYTTSFRVRDDWRECVISWDNVSPVEVVIPYEMSLTPECMKDAIDGLLCRVDNILQEEYPFRMKHSSASSINDEYEVYWSWYGTERWEWSPSMIPTDKIGVPRVRVLSAGSSNIPAEMMISVATSTLVATLLQISKNLRDLRSTLRY